MRNFIVGVLFGIVIGSVAVVWADVGVLFNSTNVEVGTAANPLYVTFN